MKKITNSLLVNENSTSYLLFSDKFGEIYIMNISEIPFGLPKILYGHSDPIHLMKISPLNNIIISADTFGKIKVCEFPNIFNLISVILYKNEEIKYLEFLNDNELIVLNSENELHLWDLLSQEIKSKTQIISDKSEEIVAIVPYTGKRIYIETSKGYYLYEKSENTLALIEKIEKNLDDSKGKIYTFLLVETTNQVNNQSNKTPEINIASNISEKTIKIIQINEEGVVLNIDARNIKN